MSVPKPQRVRKAHDFQLARTLGQVVHCKAFVFQLRIGLGSQTSPRFGVIASRRVGNAVKRNLGKRRMRALFMRCRTHLPLNADCILILRSNYAQFSFVDLEQQFLSAISRLRCANKLRAVAGNAE